MDKAKGTISKKVGPLPLWAWVAGGALALFILMRVRGGGGGTAAAGGGFVGGGGAGAPEAPPASWAGPPTSTGDPLSVPAVVNLTGPVSVAGPSTFTGPVTVQPTASSPSISAAPISSPSGGNLAGTTPITNVPAPDYQGLYVPYSGSPGGVYELPGAVQGGVQGFVDPATGAFFPGSQFATGTAP